LTSAVFKYKSKFLVPAILVILLLFSCERKFDTIKNADIITLPSLTGKNIETVFDDSGKVQLILATPLIETYNNAEDPYSEFRLGLHIDFYDGHKDPIASATSKYARFTDKKKLWELKDSVVVINEANEKLETEQLFWDQEKDLIFTDRFVKITREDQTIMGTGFESDSRLVSPVIKHVTATIYLKDE
jgi:LPS export ABC transporter protein LptC